MLILVQHGEAVAADVDPERPLTDVGKREVERVANLLAGRGIRVDGIWHSGKLRASRTAELFGAALGVEVVREAPEMAPLDDPAPVAERAAGGGDLMLVGHLPHLGRLASLLLVGDPEAGIVRFRKGGALALEPGEPGWRVAWFVTPDVV